MTVLHIPTVREHLNALGESPEWVHQLGEAIQAVTGCDAALAALRARDLSSHATLGMGLEQFTRGWQSLLAADPAPLTPLQRETLALVLHSIQHQTAAHFLKEGS